MPKPESTVVVSPFKNEKVISSSNHANTSHKAKAKASLNVSGGEFSDSDEKVMSSALEKRLEHMNNYLKNVFFTLSLNQANLDGLISIYELMK